MIDGEFAERLLAWHGQHGRRNLPWQQQPTPYRVWVSEIMLQQTQVATVSSYYQRFLIRFPDVESLAAGSIDEVLHLWSGLGYYARARNLHRAARQIRDQHGGRFPRTFDDLLAMPGIGRSTAGAILALSLGQRHPILDGNVKRVLTRFHGIAGWPGSASVSRRLWTLAEGHTPGDCVAAYTQAIMDIGATLCTRTRPDCSVCPLAADCVAHQRGLTTALPAPRPSRPRPTRDTTMLILRNSDGTVLLEQRPPQGVWGGLWSLPECPQSASPVRWCTEHLGLEVEPGAQLPTLRHSFTHFHLRIVPWLMRVKNPANMVMEAPARVWYNPRTPDTRGMATPVKRLLAGLQDDE